MKKQILKLREEGKTYDEIKEILNCSKSTISYHCNAHSREKTRLRSAERRKKTKEWLISIKENLSCEKCGESRRWVLDFHHLNSDEKENSVANLLCRASKKRILEEINKCIVLCSNCHRDLHYQEKLVI